MNSIQAKKISIIGYLASIGITPLTVKNGTAWYCSPFRNESKPSFKVDQKGNVWYDFGEGRGGNVLDLVMLINNTTVAGALLVLQKPEFSKHNYSFSEQQNSNQSKIEIKKIQPLQNRALIQYLNSRCISYSKAAKFINEAYYQVKGKQYFAIAFKNDLGGFELRNKYFKGSSSPKAITTITGSQNAVNIFEGIFDMLSALEFYQVQKPAGSCIILNSVSNLNSILSSLTDYHKINLYLDNDKTGTQAAKKIKKIHPRVNDYSKTIYPLQNDFNNYLMQRKKHPVKTEC